MGHCRSPLAASIRLRHPHCPGPWSVRPHPALYPWAVCSLLTSPPVQGVPLHWPFCLYSIFSLGLFLLPLRSLKSLSLNLSSGGDTRFEPCCGHSDPTGRDARPGAGGGCRALKGKNWEGDLPVQRVANRLNLFSLHLPDSCSPVGSP